MGSGKKVDSHTSFRDDAKQSGFKDGEFARPSVSHQPSNRCPECRSERVWRDGLRKTETGVIQRYLCRDCGLRFSESATNLKVKVDVSDQVLEEPNSGENLLQSNVLQSEFPVEPAPKNLPLKRRKDVASHVSSRKTVAEKDLYAFPDHSRERQVCVSEGEMKNLAKVESRTENWAAGATEISDATVKGKIVEYAWYLKREGYAPSTIKTRTQSIQLVARLGADLFNPESVKDVIAKQSGWSEGYKSNVAVAYTSFLQMMGKTWKAPRYKAEESLPFIPLESEIDALINGCGRQIACFLQGLKDTGADPGELAHLKWTDINYEAKSVSIRHPVKGHNPRVVPVSDALLRRLSAMPRNGQNVFCTVQGMRANFQTQRRRIAQSLSNPRIRSISFITFRHWKGTMEYHKTKDPYHVKNILGHKHLATTETYINLEAAVFDEKSDEFHFKVAENLEEVRRLIEVGFDYVGRIHDAEVFRKRK